MTFQWGRKGVVDSTPPPVIEAPAPTASSDAPAPPPQAPANTMAVELAGRGGYASAPIRGGTNPFGFGFGGRLGMDLSGLYLGATVVDFLGGKDVDLSYNALLYGVEVGWSLRFPAWSSGYLLVRPLLGLGAISVNVTDPELLAQQKGRVDVVTSASGVSSSSSPSDTTTVTSVYLRPGAVVMLGSGAHFVALDAGALVLPGISYSGAEATTWISLSADAQLGFRF